LRETLQELEFELRLKMAEKTGKHYFLVSNIYSLYREGYFWWELVEIVRSAVMTGCLILLRPGSFLQHVGGTLLLLVHLALVTIIKPYRNTYDNNVQFILSSVLVVTLPATAAVHRAKDAEERDGMLNYVIALNVFVFIFAFILRARQDMQLKEKEQLKKKVHPSPRKRPPQPPPSPPPFGNKRPLPPIKNSDPTADFDFDDRDSEEESKSDHEDEQNDGDDGYERGDRVEAKVDDSTEFYAGEVVRVNRDGTINIKFDNGKRKSGVKSSQIRSATKKDEQKIDVRPTPPKKLVLQPIRPDGQRLKPGAPSFRGLQRLNTEHRFKITRQMSALQKLDLDGDGELEPDEIIKAYMEDGLSRDEAQQKIDELRGKYDIDGDGVVSLKEALNTELANAMEEEVEEDQEKFKKDEEQHQDEHKNHTKERLRKRMEEQRKKQRGKKKQEEEFNPDKEKLEIGDRVEIKVTETSNPKKGKISRYDINSETYEVTLDNGTTIKGIKRKQLKLLPPKPKRVKPPKKDGRPLPTKTMRSTNSDKAEQVKRALKERKRKLKKQEDDDESSETSSEF